MNNKNTYLKYDWRLDGSDAEFCVDESLYPSAPDVSRPLLAYLYCAAPNGKPLADADMRRMTKLIAKCEKKLGMRFTGYIHTSMMRQYYIYIPNEETYGLLCDIVEGQKKLVVRPGCSDEPSWTTYFKLLYPDRAKLQTVRNAETIAMLYANGDSSVPRRISLHMYFASEPIRMKFEEEARLEGFAIGNTEERFYNEENDTTGGNARGENARNGNEADVNSRSGNARDGKAREKNARGKDAHGQFARGQIDRSEDNAEASAARDWRSAAKNENHGRNEDSGGRELAYGVVLHRICAMKKRDIDTITVHAVRIAERYGGELLYWDSPIVPRIGK